MWSCNLNYLVLISFVYSMGKASKELARGRNTSASRLHANKWNSSNVVDGDINTNIFCDSCLHTMADGEASAWWQVQLNGVYVIKRVEIYSREPYNTKTCPSSKPDYLQHNQESDRLKNYFIYISNDVNWTRGIQCYKEPTGPDEYPDLYQNNSCVGIGSFLTIYTKHKATFGNINSGACLTICEARVYGCKMGNYGDDCSNTCPVNCINNHCDPDSGQCLDGCKDGWTGQICNLPCPDFWYGSNCSEKCGNCYDGTSCSFTNGTCLNGCADGWIGDKCAEACSNNTYGPKCKETCGECRNNAACINTNGTCPTGCDDGYRGDLCKTECPYGTFGYNCLDECGNCLDISMCNNVDGKCLDGCIDGWLDPQCKTKCKEYTYGKNCSNICGFCKNESSCVHTNGTCSAGCDPGYRESRCNTECQQGKYGHDCGEDCGKCANGCNHVTGNCTSGKCLDGWEGQLCKDECGKGFYGPDCSHTCGKCNKGENCNHINGSCTDGCASGYKLPLCSQECDNGTFGRNCESECGNCAGQTCNRVNGNCAQGCTDGWIGVTCSVRQVSSNEPPGTDNLIIGSAVASVTVLLIAVSVIVLVWIKRRKQSKKERGNCHDNVHLDTEGDQDRCVQNESYSNSGYTNDEMDLARDNTYENTCVTPGNKEISVSNLKMVIEEKEEREIFEEEFQKFPRGATYPHEMGKLPENKIKNRFTSIYPYDHSLVRLSVIDGDPNSAYINANYIEGVDAPNVYIAAQGPKPETVEDFWRMILETKSEIIVMLTKLVELNKTKCFQYWPDESQERLRLNKLDIRIQSEKSYGAFTIRSLTLKDTRVNKSRHVTQFHFTSWPDHGTPEPMHLVLFHHIVMCRETTLNGPVVVHCSAGIGRTGTFIALDALLKYGRQNGKINVFGFVEKMRRNRMNMIQTVDQYVVLHEVLLEAFLLADTSIRKYDFSAIWEMMMKKDLPMNKNRSRIEFKSLNNVRSTINLQSSADALGEENKEKNRDPSVIPVLKYRPFLRSQLGNRSNYINATIIPSLMYSNAFITTQCPLKHTIQDFWCLMYDHESSVVIVLEPKGTTESFVPEASEKHTYGLFTVHAPQEKTISNGFSETEVSLVKQNDNLGTKRIKIIESNCWKFRESLPTSSAHFLPLMKKAREIKESYIGEGPVTVVCFDGASKCGMFCAVYNILERLDDTDEVDVSYAVRQIQIRSPQSITNVEQYEYCYRIVHDYLESDVIYMNM